VALNLKGACHKQLNDSVRANAAYDAMLAIDPNDWCAHNNKGLIFKERGDFAHAQEEYAVAIKFCITQPSQGICRANMALVVAETAWRLKENKATDAAIVQFNEALRYDPTFAAAHFHLVRKEGGNTLDPNNLDNPPQRAFSCLSVCLCDCGFSWVSTVCRGSFTWNVGT